MKSEEAKIIASDFIISHYDNSGDELVILDVETIEKQYGRCFFSISRRFLRTKKFEDIVLGNGPVLVEKKTGNVIQFGTAYPIETYLELYENERL